MLGVVWYVLLVIVIITGLNIIIDYKRYGKRIFDCFKKVDTDLDMKELLINTIKKEIRDKVLIIKRNENYFLAITKFGIFLIQVIDEKGIISGNIYDDVFNVRKGKVREIKNPFKQFIKETNILIENNIEIKPLIVKTSKDCNLNLSNLDKISVSSMGDFSYLLYKLQHSSFKYSDDEVRNIVSKMKVLLDGNN